MKNFLGCLAIVLLISCKSKTESKTLKVGYYRATLELQDNQVLPFIFEVESATQLKVYNAEEVIEVDEIEYKNDSVYIKLPVFEGYIAAKFEGEQLDGSFIKKDLNRIVPFSAVPNIKERFDVASQATQNSTGIWETVFSPDIKDEDYVAKGIFKQDGDIVTGTFRTETGDYRYLEGVMDGNTMKLSAFDGAHAFLFIATVSDSTMNGTFYSGNHWKEPFTAKRNETYELPNADSLTFLNEGYERFDFEFPDTSGKIISLKDERFKDKVVIVQIMGTWCPNCLDESKYYAEFYKNNKDKEIEFVALAFEYAKTEAEAFKRIERLQESIGIAYPIVLAQYGTSDKAKAQEKLPMLNHVLSYPTSIYIDKTGKVRKIHTGFNGPATGEKYVEFKSEFEGFVAELLSE